MNSQRRVYVTVALDIRKNANEQEIFAECDYQFIHQDILDTEILEIESATE